jgi:putative hemolysin
MNGGIRHQIFMRLTSFRHSLFAQSTSLIKKSSHARITGMTQKELRMEELAIKPSVLSQPKPAVSSPAISTTPQPSETLNPKSIVVTWAQHQDEVREAQRLRFAVFAGEMGANLSSKVPGHDVDLFDDFCEHLLVRDANTQQVVGTYRVLTPAQARRVGGTYTDTEFDLTRLRHIRDRMVELGRSCVHPDHRHGGVIMALWGALFDFMDRNDLDTMIGCATIPMQHEGPHGMVGGGHAAASIWRQVKDKHLAGIDMHVRPRLPLPIDQLDDSLDVEPPALIKGYLRLGAKVLGPPAWDPDFNAADLPMLMRAADLPARYRKFLLGA